ncbi:MAG: dihydroorotase [Bacteroidota bacterium]|nr:dihydroorotase [Bacteroidota bacterium]
MTQNYVIRNANIVNEGKIFAGDIYIKNQKIEKVASRIGTIIEKHIEIDAKGKYLLPGIIDDQVHFREPGLTHKATIYSEAKAAVAGGVTTFMEMPNTVPSAVTNELLEQKYLIASQSSLANYSFYLGTTNSNLEDVLKIDSKNVCGLKIFLGSSTGDMLVDNKDTLEKVFAQCPTLIAIHSEQDEIVKANLEKWKQKYGDDVPVEAHPEIRSVEACYKMTEYAVGLAKKHDTKLHVLHISTEEELVFFRNDIPLKDKRITAEVCVHHLWFTADDYANKGNFIKWNPAIKDKRHQPKLFEAMLDNRLDIIATDHAPHTLEEKQQSYLKAPSGGPLIQHSLNVMLEFYHQGKITLEKIVDKMSHKPAELFQIEKRGFIREGYYADLVLVDLQKPWKVSKENILYKCGWSPLEGQNFKGKVTHTFVSGHLAYQEGQFDEQVKGKRLAFVR